MTNVDRGILIGCSLSFTAIAAMLLFSPERFYSTIPGVAESGPMNLHLLRDVGLAYAVMATGVAFGLRDLRVAQIATAGSALYLALHALLHAFMELQARNPSVALAEAPGVYLPAAVMIALAVRFRR